SYPVIQDSNQLADYITYVVAEDASKGSVTVVELKSCIISHNPSAALSELNALTNRTVEEVKSSPISAYPKNGFRLCAAAGRIGFMAKVKQYGLTLLFPLGMYVVFALLAWAFGGDLFFSRWTAS
ncbi:MAG: hypothetical protein LBC41_17895, partial [Clostridiales bacterium]|nr:hypothetical protein [Clostridiales bacterium]